MESTSDKSNEVLKPLKTEGEKPLETTTKVVPVLEREGNKNKEYSTEKEQARNISSELRSLDTEEEKVRKEEPQAKRNQAADKQPLKLLEQLRNNLMYPSTSFLGKTFLLPPLAADATLVTANLINVNPEIYMSTVAAVAVTNSVYFAELLKAFRERIKINDLMKLGKVASPKKRIFQDGKTVNKGEIVGEMHMEGANVVREWRSMSDFQRGKAMTQAGLDSLLTLAQLCKADSKYTKGMSAFYGTSDIIRPEFMKKLGFEVADVNGSLLIKFGIKIKRMKALGIKEGLRTSIGKFYEAWITRDELIESIPKIQHYQEILLKRSASPQAVETPTF
jgi:hypothetical protein